MPGYQNVTIVGHVGGDPVLRYTATGVAVCNFSVAVSQHWTDKVTAEAKEKTVWFNVAAWRGLAETCGQFVKKGTCVMVVGTIELSTFTGTDGAMRASLELTAQTVQFLSRGGDAASRPTEADEIPF